MNKKRFFTLSLAAILILSFSTFCFAQKNSDILGSWVRVGQGVGKAAESAFKEVNDVDYLKLQFQKNGKLKIYGSYVANGIETNYKFKRGKITYGFNRAFELESYSDSSLVLIELESGKARDSFVKHYYLKEKAFLNRLEVGQNDWFISEGDTVYFASKKLYPQFKAVKYPDFHLYVHNMAKEAYSDGPNYMLATFSIEPNGNVKDIEIWHHTNEEADAKVEAAIQNSSNRWDMPLLNEQGVTLNMHVDDSYVKRDTRSELSIALNQNEVFVNNADAYRNGILLVARSFKLKDYNSVLKYIEICEQIAPEEPNLFYLRYRAYLAINNERKMNEAVTLLKQSKLNYLVR